MGAENTEITEVTEHFKSRGCGPRCEGEATRMTQWNGGIVMLRLMYDYFSYGYIPRYIE